MARPGAQCSQLRLGVACQLFWFFFADPKKNSGQVAVATAETVLKYVLQSIVVDRGIIHRLFIILIDRY